MPDENIADQSRTQSVEAAVVVSLAQSEEELIASVVAANGACEWLAFTDGSVSPAELGAVDLPPSDNTLVVTQLRPMTDAMKRVAANEVVTTVDRSLLQVVEAPVLVPTALAVRWATTDRQGGPMSSVDLSRLLSELAAIEPGMRVIGFESP